MDNSKEIKIVIDKIYNGYVTKWKIMANDKKHLLTSNMKNYKKLVKMIEEAKQIDSENCSE